MSRTVKGFLNATSASLFGFASTLIGSTSYVSALFGIVPATDNVVTLGLPSYRFANVYHSPESVIARQTTGVNVSSAGGGNLFDTIDSNTLGMVAATVGGYTTFTWTGTDQLFVVVTAYVEWASNAVGFRKQQIFLNSGTVCNSSVGANTASLTSQNCTAAFSMNTGDTISVRLFHNAGVDLAVTGRIVITALDR